MHTDEFLARVLELAQKNYFDHEAARILTDEGYEDVKATTIAEIVSNGSLLSRGLVTKGELADLREMRKKRGAQRHGPALTVASGIKRSPSLKPGVVYRPGEPFYMLSEEAQRWTAEVQKALEAKMPHMHAHHTTCQFDLGGPTHRAGVCKLTPFGRLFGSSSYVPEKTGILGTHMAEWCVGHGYAVLASPGKNDLEKALSRLTGLSLSDFVEEEAEAA